MWAVMEKADPSVFVSTNAEGLSEDSFILFALLVGQSHHFLFTSIIVYSL